MSKLLIIDTFGLIFRAFHAYPILTTADGHPTNAIFGFLQMLIGTIEKQDPSHLVCSLESATPTFRHELAADYKANRKPAADEIKIQIGDIKEIIESLGIKVLQKDGFEADDVIGSYATQHQNDFDEIKILTGDRDLFQLLRDNIRILMPGRFFSDLGEYDRAKFEEKYEIKLEDFVLYKSLIGDSSDNIKGIPGVGPKTAVKIVNQYHSIDSILANLDQLPPKVAESITEYQNLWRDYYKLSKIDIDIELPLEPEETKISKIQFRKLRNIIDRYELRTLQPKIGKFIDKFEEKHGGFGLFAEDEGQSDKKTEIACSVVERVEFQELDKIFDVQSGCQAFVLFAANPDRVRLGNGKDFVEIEIHENLKELFNFVINNKIKKFVGFDLKPFIKTLLESGIEHIENYEFIDLQLAWYLIKHDSGFQSINDIVKFFNEDDYQVLLNKTYEELKANDIVKLFDMEKDLQKVIGSMEFTGICCDKDYLISLQKEIQVKIDEVTKEIYDFVGHEFKINSPKELSHILYNVLHLPQLKKTKTGVSTDDQTLTKLEGQSDIIPLIKRYRMYTKAQSTYIIALQDYIKEDGKIHTTFQQTTVATGRLSSIYPNLQNLPGDPEIGGLIRQAFVPSDKNMMFISFDYSQIDLRVLAFESQDKGLLEAFKNDEDIHTTTARTVFDKQDVTKEERSFAKTINFGIVYGMEPYGLSQALKVDQKTAKDFIEKYFEKFSGVKKYFEKITKQLDEKQYVNTFLNRKRFFPSWQHANGIQKRTFFREAINMPIQGGSSEIIKIAMNQIFEYINKESIKAKLILQIHDELIFEVDKSEDLDAFKERVQDLMSNSYDISVPLKVSLKEGEDLRFI